LLHTLLAGSPLPESRTHLNGWARHWVGSFTGIGPWSRAEDVAELERPLATTRVLVGASLVASALLAQQSSSHVILWISSIYCAYALCLRGYLALGADPTVRFQLVTQAVDVVAGVGVGLLSPFPGAAGLAVLVHAAVAASVRWGYSASFACIAAAAATLILGRVNSDGLTIQPIDGSTANQWFALLFPPTMAVGAVLAQLGDLTRERRSRDRTLARIKASARPENGFRTALHSVLAELAQSFDARGARVLAHNCTGTRAFLWELTGSRAASGSLRCVQIDDFDPDRGPDEPFLDPATRTPVWIEPFVTGEWSGHVMLIEPRLGPGRRRRAALFAQLVREVAPALYDGYRVARVRSRVVALERTRLARHLHDVTIQSLIGAEMEIEVLCHRYRHTGPDSLSVDLARIQKLVHRETLNLRDLMLQMKPIDITPDELPDLLQDIVDRFSHDSGVNATFRSKHLGSVHISTRMCTEIARIVQEGLSNVRKHSGATHASVRLEPTVGGLFLVVEDDGRGFNFDGRVRLSPHLVGKSQGATLTPVANSTLDHLRSWKLSAMRESVRSVGGELVLESTRGRGSRLEIRIPTQRTPEISRSRVVS
jgi:signal transduction histidine kinase